MRHVTTIIKCELAIKANRSIGPSVRGREGLIPGFAPLDVFCDRVAPNPPWRHFMWTRAAGGVPNFAWFNMRAVIPWGI